MSDNALLQLALFVVTPIQMVTVVVAVIVIRRAWADTNWALNDIARHLLVASGRGDSWSQTSRDPTQESPGVPRDGTGIVHLTVSVGPAEPSSGADTARCPVAGSA